MPTLNLAFLGAPRIELDGQPVEIPARKAVALLAYLAVTGQPHSRERLAALFWPEADAEHARGALRAALVALRRSLGDGWLVAEGDALRLESGVRGQESGGREQGIADRIELDVARFRAELTAARGHAHPASTACQARLAAAADLYRGDLLAGFTLPDCPAFDEWLFFEAEGLRRDLADALERLATSHAAGGEIELAITAARRWLALDPLHEPAHRGLMRLYALAGQRAAALRQFEECGRILTTELGSSPDSETRALHAAIRAGHILPLIRPAEAAAPAAKAPPAVRLPAFLQGETAEPPRPLFVARERELARLHAFLDTACQPGGHGQVAFVTGEAGAGKSSLLAEFLRQATDRHPDLLAVGGACTALGGLGDPYLPFRQALAMLTGDLAGRVASGAVLRAQAARLWEALPETLGALIERGPALPGLFLSPAPLLACAQDVLPADDPALARLRQLIARSADTAVELQAGQLFSQVMGFLAAVTAAGPLLLVLDDLQWADAGTASLLFHLSRSLAGSRLLLIGAYRPEEVPADDPRQPLGKALAEIKRSFGDAWIELDASTPDVGRAFVDAYLDATPNALGPAFRAALHAHTGGHALFTAEIVHALRERGLLVSDGERGWVEAGEIVWAQLPARVEGVIEERLGRLPADLRGLLQAASVEGEEFTAQVIAHALGGDERTVLRQLGRDLERTHRLVARQGVVQVAGRSLDRFRFRHALFQQHCYAGLDAGERRLLHGDIAMALEEVYDRAKDDLAPQLGWHWEQAGHGAKAIPYLLAAGDRARLTYANTDALGFYQRCLTLLRRQGDDEETARVLMRLGLVYHAIFDHEQARLAYDESFLLWQRATAALRASGSWQPSPHTFRFLYDMNLPLDPAYAASLRTFTHHLFSGLLQESPDMEALPDLATHWDNIDDGKAYIFHLRKDTCWSDGVTVTAHDFEYAWKRFLDPKTEAWLPTILFDIKGARAYNQGTLSDPAQIGVHALDDHTLIVELERPISYFLHVLTMPGAMPVPRHVVERYGRGWIAPGKIVTNGPFLVESWQPGAQLTMARYPAYHGPRIGNLQRAVAILGGLPPQTDWRARYELYRTDQVDHLNTSEFATEAIRLLRTAHPGEYRRVPIWVTTSWGFNLRLPPFDDVRVRQALAMAFDRLAFTRAVYGLDELPASGGIIPPAMPGHAAEIGLPYDPARARELLAEAGYPQGRGFPEVSILASDTDLARSQTQWLETQWQESLGIRCNHRFVMPGIFRAMLAQLRLPAVHVLAMAWMAAYPDPDSILRSWYWGRIQPQTNCRNAAYEALVEEARCLTDQATRIRLYRQADAILSREAVTIPLRRVAIHLLIKPWVRHYHMSPVGAAFFERVTIEPH
jgi:ABC-type oligopeptide transport system substrate-binding subunit/DNA-binding SARP family transcriptional activator